MTAFMIPDDATEAETAELAAEQRELARAARTAESDEAFRRVLLKFPGFPPVQAAGPVIVAVEA